MTAGTHTGVLARAQWLVQNNRSIPDAAHRTFGRFSEVGTEPFLAPGQFPWTALLEQHYPAIRAEAERVLHVRDALPTFQDIASDRINRPPMNRINDGIIKAVSKSPFIKNARAQHLAREERFTAAWNAVVGAPGSAPVSRHG